MDKISHPASTPSKAARPRAMWRLRRGSLALGSSTCVMGILNVTPDSFSDGGRFRSHSEAVEAALRMFEEGAVVVDIGGESTRPGLRSPVTPQEEIDRVLPVIEDVLRSRPEALLSVDTYRASTAEASIAAGAEIVNDVSGLLWDPAMAGACARLGCGVVMTHTRGRPEEWKLLPPLRTSEVVPLVLGDLAERLAAATAAGVVPNHIVLDPGFGFGKAFGNNYPLLARLAELRALGRPLLAGVSRKSFLGRTLAPLFHGEDAPVAARENATLAAVVAAVLHGADLVRVHEVRPAVEASAIADAVLDAQEQTRAAGEAESPA